MFTTQYSKIIQECEAHSGDNYTLPNQALSPQEILDRFVKALPVKQTSQPTGQVNDDITSPSLFQGQEYDVMDVHQYLADQDGNNQTDGK